MKQKNKTRLARAAMTLLLALLTTFGAWAQTTVTIGDGTTTGYYTPIGTYYAYSITEQLYTAEEIGMAGTIESISFYYAYNAAKDFPITVYMMNTDAADLTTGISLADADEVFSGTLSVPAEAGWVTITLDNPFEYDGSSNLLIGVNKGNASWYSGSTWQYTAATKMARYSQNDNNAYDITSTVPGTVTSNRPNIQIEITPSSGLNCEKPATLEVTDITGYGATCTWTSEVGNYTFEYKKASANNWTVVSGLTSTSYTLSNLEPFTAYNVRVKAVCGTDLESGYKTANFTTPEVCPDGKVCIGEGTATNSYMPANNYYKYSLTQQIYTADEIGDAGAILSLDFYKASTVEMTNKDLDIYIVNTTKDNFDSNSDWIPVTASDKVFSGKVTFTDNAWTTIVLDNPFIYDGSSNICIVVDNNTGSYVSSTPFFVFVADAEKNQTLYFQSDGTNPDPTDSPSNASGLLNSKNRIRLGMGEIPDCAKPTGLTVNYTGGTTAEVSWTGDAETYNIDVNGTVTEGVTSPYTLNGLELATTYNVKVQANCGNSTSEWTNPVSFTTAMCLPEDMCVISYELSDSYGDGWNGNYIEVIDVQTNTVLATWTISSGSSASGTLMVCDGRQIQFNYVIPGSYTYPGENSFVITDINDQVIWEVDQCSSSTGSFTHTVNCTVDLCRKPSNLAASEIEAIGAKLSWTGIQEAYNMRYRQPTSADPTAPATIILTAGDVWGDNSGYQMLLDADATAYGTTIPTSGPLTQSGDASDATYAEFEYKIPENADGALDTENIVFNNSITIQIPAGTYDWCITNPSSGDRMWIVGDGNVPGRYDNFVFEPGVTYEFSMQMFGTGDGAAFTVTPMSEWITVGNVTSPYTLTGLTPSTPYEWQVQGISSDCTDGVTGWSEPAFFITTGEPIKFAAEGYATYYNSQKDVVLPAGMKAHIVTLATATSANDATLTYETIADGNTGGNVVPAGNAMMLQVAPAGAAQTLSIGLATATTGTYSGNKLHGSDERVYIPYLPDYSENNNYYMLSYDSSGANIGWYWDKENTDGTGFWSGAHKAWLVLPKSLFQGSGAPFLGLPGWEETTGIVPVGVNSEDGEWYTLQGLKIGKKPTTAGVYIHNGRKVIVK